MRELLWLIDSSLAFDIFKKKHQYLTLCLYVSLQSATSSTLVWSSGTFQSTIPQVSCRPPHDISAAPTAEAIYRNRSQAGLAIQKLTVGGSAEKQGESYVSSTVEYHTRSYVHPQKQNERKRLRLLSTPVLGELWLTAPDQHRERVLHRISPAQEKISIQNSTSTVSTECMSFSHYCKVEKS